MANHTHMSAKKAAAKKPAPKAKDLKPKKDAKGGPAYMKLGDIKGEVSSRG